MKEIICINIGQAGIKIGNSFWDLLAHEHGIKLDGTKEYTAEDEYPKVFFSQTEKETFVPRCISIDLEMDTSIGFSTGPYRNFFSKDSIISGKQGGCTFPVANEGAEAKKIQEQALNRIKKLAETCKNSPDFMVFNSAAGGTGAGMGKAMMEKLQSSFSGSNIINMVLCPSARLSNSPIEPYNALLAHTVFSNDLSSVMSVLFDNEALYNLIIQNLQISSPGYKNINQLVAQAVGAMTSNMRYGPNPTRLKEIHTNLAPFRTQSILTPSYNPILDLGRYYLEEPPVSFITDALFDPSNSMLSCGSDESTIIACCLMYRGDVSQYDVNNAIDDTKAKRKLKVAACSPQPIKSFILNRPPVTLGEDLAKTSRSGMLLMNSSSVVHYFNDISSKFDSLFSKRAFIHWFFKEDPDIPSHLCQAREDLQLIKSDYLNPSLEAQDSIA